MLENEESLKSVSSKLFEIFDKDRNGSIDFFELREFIS